jgi:serine/threonine protein phosphatase PrpC
MRMKLLCLAIWILSLAWPTCAQLAPQPDVLSLDTWRVHAGDDSSWASPAFDVSRWQTVSYPVQVGREIELENGFPLGVAAQSTYTETEIQTAGRITLLSDGVVEARNAKGELLGFDRMAALPAKPAAESADTRQRWGQEDDITVLSVSRIVGLNPALA